MIGREASSIHEKVMNVMSGHYDSKTNLSNIEIVSSLLDDNEIDYVLNADCTHQASIYITLKDFLPEYLKNKIEDIFLK